jgi:ketosteroid isomerase-like protein
MKKSYLILIILLTSILVVAQKPAQSDIDAIRNVMAEQQEAWNRADLESFMQGYWKSDSLKFIGRNGIAYGWSTTLENYKKGYPTPDAMGKLTFTILDLQILDSQNAFMIGKFHLKRSNDEPSGYFTLLWKKIRGKWVIVTDHTS